MRCGLGWGRYVSMEVVILDIAIKGSSTVYGVVKKSRWVKQSYFEPSRFFTRHININSQNNINSYLSIFWYVMNNLSLTIHFGIRLAP